MISSAISAKKFYIVVVPSNFGIR